MNSEAEKNPDGLNIRQELETLRDHYRSVGRVCDYYDDGGINDDIAYDLTALLQRIPEGWELRPREPSVDQRRSGSMVLYYAGYNGDEYEAETAACECWRVMWDQSGER